MAIADEAERAQVVAEMNAARNEEYGEVLERLPEFLAELDKERARGRTTYAEVEECEADLDRYRSWLAKIAARDYFGAPGGAGARAAVAAAAAELATFCVRPSRGPCSPGETLVGYPCPALMPGIGVGGEISRRPAAAAGLAIRTGTTRLDGDPRLAGPRYRAPHKGPRDRRGIRPPG